MEDVEVKVLIHAEEGSYGEEKTRVCWHEVNRDEEFGNEVRKPGQVNENDNVEMGRTSDDERILLERDGQAESGTKKIRNSIMNDADRGGFRSEEYKMRIDGDGPKQSCGHEQFIKKWAQQLDGFEKGNYNKNWNENYNENWNENWNEKCNEDSSESYDESGDNNCNEGYNGECKEACSESCNENWNQNFNDNWNENCNEGRNEAITGNCNEGRKEKWNKGCNKYEPRCEFVSTTSNQRRIKDTKTFAQLFSEIYCKVFYGRSKKICLGASAEEWNGNHGELAEGTGTRSDDGLSKSSTKTCRDDDDANISDSVEKRMKMHSIRDAMGSFKTAVDQHEEMHDLIRFDDSLLDHPRRKNPAGETRGCLTLREELSLLARSSKGVFLGLTCGKNREAKPDFIGERILTRFKSANRPLDDSQSTHHGLHLEIAPFNGNEDNLAEKCDRMAFPTIIDEIKTHNGNNGLLQALDNCDDGGIVDGSEILTRLGGKRRNKGNRCRVGFQTFLDEISKAASIKGLMEVFHSEKAKDSVAKRSAQHLTECTEEGKVDESQAAKFTASLSNAKMKSSSEPAKDNKAWQEGKSVENYLTRTRNSDEIKSTVKERLVSSIEEIQSFTSKYVYSKIVAKIALPEALKDVLAMMQEDDSELEIADFDAEGNAFLFAADAKTTDFEDVITKRMKADGGLKYKNCEQKEMLLRYEALPPGLSLKKETKS